MLSIEAKYQEGGNEYEKTWIPLRGMVAQTRRNEWSLVGMPTKTFLGPRQIRSNSFGGAGLELASPKDPFKRTLKRAFLYKTGPNIVQYPRLASTNR